MFITIKKNLLSTAIVLSVVAFLSGCTSSLSGDASSSVDSQSQFQDVSESDFRAALKKTVKEYDDFEEETTYRPSGSVGYEDDFFISMNVYIPDSGDVYGLLFVNYFASDWIFFDTLEARANGETYELLSTSSLDKYQEVEDGGFVQEIGAEELTTELVAAIAAVTADPEAKLRLSGSDGSIERPITSRERAALENMTVVYSGFMQGLID